jgi:hypothetical protein
MDLDLPDGHGHSMDLHMHYVHEHAAWARKCSMGMETQHGQIHAACPCPGLCPCCVLYFQFKIRNKTHETELKQLGVLVYFGSKKTVSQGTLPPGTGTGFFLTVVFLLKKNNNRALFLPNK